MTARRKFTDEEIALAVQLQAQGVGITPISRRLRCGHDPLRRALRERGLHIRQARGGVGRHGMDRAMDLPIGEVPPGHPFYELDQLMAQARRDPARAGLALGKSSLADL